MRTIRNGVKRAFAAAAAGALASLCAVTADAEEKPDFNVETNAPPHIVFLGDSITAGYGLDGYSPDNKSLCPSFANILSAEFGDELPAQADFSMVNFGEDGLTSRALLKKLRSGELDEKLHEADAVVISIGGNDMLHTFLSVINKDNSIPEIVGKLLDLSNDLDKDLEGFNDNMPEIAEELGERTEGRIFVQTLYNPLEDTAISKLNTMSDEKIGKLNDIICEYSGDGEKYVVIDVAEQFKGRSKELTNIDDYDIHPNADGHAVIADVIYNKIEEYSYTYYDAEAAMQYELDEARKRQEEEEKKAKKTKTAIVCSGVGATALLSAGVFAVVRRKKSV